MFLSFRIAFSRFWAIVEKETTTIPFWKGIYSKKKEFGLKENLVQKGLGVQESKQDIQKLSTLQKKRGGWGAEIVPSVCRLSIFVVPTL